MIEGAVERGLVEGAGLVRRLDLVLLVVAAVHGEGAGGGALLQRGGAQGGEGGRRGLDDLRRDPGLVLRDVDDALLAGGILRRRVEVGPAVRRAAAAYCDVAREVISRWA